MNREPLNTMHATRNYYLEMYTREQLLKAYRPYALPKEVQDKLAELNILSSGSNQPFGLADHIEPLVNVNSSSASRDVARRRPGSRRLNDEPVQETNEDAAGEWHTVGERKSKKDNGKSTAWRKQSPTTEDNQQPSFFEEGEGNDDKSRITKLRNARPSPSVLASPPTLQWLYIDNSGKRQGPFSTEQMAAWQQGGYLQPDLPIAFFTDRQPTQFTPMKALFPSSTKPFVDAPVVVQKQTSAAAPWSR